MAPYGRNLSRRTRILHVDRMADGRARRETQVYLRGNAPLLSTPPLSVHGARTNRRYTFHAFSLSLPLPRLPFPCLCSCLKTNPWLNTGKTLPRTRSKTRPRRCIRIASCSSRPAHRCQRRFVFRFEETFSICRASSSVSSPSSPPRPPFFFLDIPHTMRGADELCLFVCLIIKASGYLCYKPMRFPALVLGRPPPPPLPTFPFSHHTRVFSFPLSLFWSYLRMSYAVAISIRFRVPSPGEHVHVDPISHVFAWINRSSWIGFLFCSFSFILSFIFLFPSLSLSLSGRH